MPIGTRITPERQHQKRRQRKEHGGAREGRVVASAAVLHQGEQRGRSAGAHGQRRVEQRIDGPVMAHPEVTRRQEGHQIELRTGGKADQRHRDPLRPERRGIAQDQTPHDRQQQRQTGHAGRPETIDQSAHEDPRADDRCAIHPLQQRRLRRAQALIGERGDNVGSDAGDGEVREEDRAEQHPEPVSTERFPDTESSCAGTGRVGRCSGCRQILYCWGCSIRNGAYYTQY